MVHLGIEQPVVRRIPFRWLTRAFQPRPFASGNNRLARGLPLQLQAGEAVGAGGKPLQKLVIGPIWRPSASHV